jgi:apolipoprotein D and lipocalin family protein
MKVVMFTKNYHVFGVICVAFLSFACGGSYAPLPTVDYVDPVKYLGKWYEIARLPNSFQKQCAQSTAEYSKIDDETIRVVNRCSQTGSDKSDGIEGKAFVVPNSGNAKLKVQFFWPFKGDYWIIALDKENYQWAIVGEPKRKYLWILARQASIDNKLFTQLKEMAGEKGFDVSKLIVTESQK